MLRKLKFKTPLFALFIVAFLGTVILSHKDYALANTSESTADLRIIFTTDIHGQLTSTDYETGSSLSVGGLTRAYNIIKQARDEVNNYLTFDIGDVLYDYTTEYIYAKDQKTLQPIYQAMMTIGYDAITLGNHEFDYEFDYVNYQLEASGFKDITVVSNVTDSKTGEHPFLENMIITKSLTMEDGKTMDVNIGIIGETLPVLSSKGQDYTGVLKVQDIVENVTEQSAKLKEAGADLIVVLAHTGMGPENPEYLEKNVAYALTKIDEVDAVLCGHEHNAFPSEDKSGAYYKLSGVDKKTNLVNGKNLVMAEDRGESVGVIDFTLTMNDGDVEVVDRKSDLRKATNKNSVEEKAIASLYDEYSEGMLEYTKQEIGKVDAENLIENFNGLVEDNSAIQLLNDAKRAYALNYIHNKAKEYIGYPVIAASSYSSYGANSYLDYVNVSGSLTESDLASLQGYNGYTALYKITGKQLKEWLEWTASAYTWVYQKENLIQGTMADYVKASGVQSLIANDWLEDWSSFYVFDGVEYTINTGMPARYNIYGVKVNSTNRIEHLTYNGDAVTDDQIFVLSVGKLAKGTEANAGVEKQSIYKGYVKTQGIITDYIQQQYNLGSLNIEPDYNWNITFPHKYNFLVRTSSIGEEQLKSSSWFVKQVGTKNDYIYSVGSFDGQEDKNKMNILLSLTYTEPTSEKVKVAVAATSRSKVTEVRYLKGDYAEDAEMWVLANKVENNYFYADSNGVYTVYAMDEDGNKQIEKINIKNIYTNTVRKPTVETYTNRKTKISGTAEIGTTVVITASGETYITRADTTGAFSYALPAQKSGTKVSLYATKPNTGERSEDVVVTVKRTGPNQPIVYGAYNNSDFIKGNLNDNDAHVLAIVNNTVYVGNEETAELYRNCSTIFKEEYKVVVTEVRVDSTNEFMLRVPCQKIGTNVLIYTIDHINRSSRSNQVIVEDVAPNPPEVYELTAGDDRVQGRVTSSKSKTEFSVYVTIGNQSYVTTTDTDGYFNVAVDPSLLTIGKEVSVYAKDKVNYIKRTSYTVTVSVKDPDIFVTDNNDLSLDMFFASDTVVTGSNDDAGDITVTIKSGNSFTAYHVNVESGRGFSVPLLKPLKAGDIVYAFSRSFDGSILDMVRTVVDNVEPIIPVLDYDITNMTTEIIAYSNVQCTIVVKIGKDVYESSKSFYNDVEEMYQFNIKVPQIPSGKNVEIYAYNEEGTSEVRTTKVLKFVPDAPTVKKIYTTSKSISGTIELIDETKIFAQIGDTIYEGTVKEDGSFTIKIPKQKEKTKIVVWGENEEGTGIKRTVTVTKKTE